MVLNHVMYKCNVQQPKISFASVAAQLSNYAYFRKVSSRPNCVTSEHNEDIERNYGNTNFFFFADMVVVCAFAFTSYSITTWKVLSVIDIKSCHAFRAQEFEFRLLFADCPRRCIPKNFKEKVIWSPRKKVEWHFIYAKVAHCSPQISPTSTSVCNSYAR